MPDEPVTSSEPTEEAQGLAGELGSEPVDGGPGSEVRDPRALRFEQGLWGNLERLNQVVAKAIDLAESSLSLGARMVSGLGKLSERQILDRVRDAEAAAAAPPEAPRDEAAASGAPPFEGAVEGPGVANRAPLRPGSEVRVPFSLTNESAEAERQVRVSLRDLVGVATGQRLAADALSVEPPEATLAPLDFEKFVIRGQLPGETAPDTYRGVIVVEGDDLLTIPLLLSVI